jgi:glycerol uptake facilitator protein
MSQTPTLGQKCLAEFLGTAFLVFIGAGVAAASGLLLGSAAAAITMADLIAIALAFGFALAVMVYAIGRISSCHLNPAVSIAMATFKQMNWNEAGAYIAAQLLGAIVGALLIALAFPGAASTVTGLGVTNFKELYTSYFAATLLEAVGTFFLVFVIMATAVDQRANPAVSGLAIGLTLACGIFVLGPITGGSLNPARSIGPVLVQWIMGGSYPPAHLLVYIIGPIVGGLLGALAYAGVTSLKSGREPDGPRTPATH